jgi:hypothetical protein
MTSPPRGLAEEMQRPYPDRARVATHARSARAELEKVSGPLLSRKGISDLLANGGGSQTNWDAAEQVYLALHALQGSTADAKLAAVLKDLTPLRAFPPGYDGPLSVARNKRSAFQPAAFFLKLNEHLKDIR